VCIGDNNSVNTTFYDTPRSLPALFIFYGRKRAGSLLLPVTFRRRGCTIYIYNTRVFSNRFFIINYFALAIWHFPSYIYIYMHTATRQTLARLYAYTRWRRSALAERGDGAENCQIWIKFNGRELLQSFAPARNSRGQFNGA